MPKMKKQGEELAKQVAEDKEWTYLGLETTEVESDVTDTDRLKVGREQTELMVGVGRLEKEKDEYNSRIKSQIKNSNLEIQKNVRILDTGRWFVDQKLPCFIDINKGIRIYMDKAMDTVLKNEPMQANDHQPELDMGGPDAEEE